MKLNEKPDSIRTLKIEEVEIKKDEEDRLKSR